jgi:hypothetical protein
MINPNPVMAVAAAGLTPISPSTVVIPVVEIPDFVNVVKSPAERRFIGPGPTGAISVKLAVMFLFLSMITVNGLEVPEASPLQEVKV